MKSFLLLIAGIAVLFAPIPLAAWAARGRRKDAWEATKGYWKVMGLMIGVGLVIAAVMFVSSATA